MLLWLGEYLTQYYSAFNVFSYLTFRAIISTLTALVISLYFGPKLIRGLQRMQIGQTVRDDGPESHLSKSGTPTMGGVLILLSISVSTLLWGNLENKYVWITLLVTLAFGVIGWIDDYRKLILKDSAGLAGRWKYLLQSVFGLAAVLYLYFYGDTSITTQLVLPILSDTSWHLGWLAIPLGYFVIVGSSNAVNLTDGLDGLAIGPIISTTTALISLRKSSMLDGELLQIT